jgi:hypothetical protein
MENSRAYKYLIEGVNATGWEKKDGYYPNIMEEIYDWERDEVEKIIWETFHKNEDAYLAQFLPKLKNYNGIRALKIMLWRTGSLEVADALYRATKNTRYLKIFRSHYKANKDDISTVAMLTYLPPDENVLDLLKEIYIDSENSVIRTAAVDGILYNKGYLSDPLNMSEATAQLPLRRQFMSDNREERKEILDKFLRGELDSYKE